jgi:hypothetical protein
MFENLEWDYDYNRWSGTVSIGGSDGVRVRIDPTESRPDEMTISEDARRAFRTISESETRIREAACAELLATYNQAWNNGAPIEAETFKRRLVLEAITIYEEGMAEIFFGDDDMFAGHSVVVSMNEDGEFDSATIAG